MRRTKLLGAALAVTASVIAGSAFGEVKNLRAANVFSPEHPLGKFGYIWWADEVKRLSGGDLSIEVFSGGSLLPARGAITGVRDGVADVGLVIAIYTPSALPLTNALQELGVNFDDQLEPMLAGAELAMTDPDFIKEYQSVGIVYTGAQSTATYNLFCTSAIQTVEDMKGKKVRTPGGSFSRWVESVGGVPVNVPATEMYTGLEKGALDCAANAGTDLKALSLWDVAKHTTVGIPGGIYFSSPLWAFNPKTWSGLSVDERKAIFAASANSMAEIYVNYNRGASDAFAEAPEHGVQLYRDVPELKSDVETFRQSNREEFKNVAKDTYGIDDPDSLLSKFEESLDKWRAAFEGVDKKDANAIAAVIQSELYDKIDASSYGVK